MRPSSECPAPWVANAKTLAASEGVPQSDMRLRFDVWIKCGGSLVVELQLCHNRSASGNANRGSACDTFEEAYVLPGHRRPSMLFCGPTCGLRGRDPQLIARQKAIHGGGQIVNVLRIFHDVAAVRGNHFASASAHCRN